MQKVRQVRPFGNGFVHRFGCLLLDVVLGTITVCLALAGMGTATEYRSFP